MHQWIVLISDSLPIGGSTGGNFSIGGLVIIEKDGVAWIWLISLSKASLTECGELTNSEKEWHISYK